MEERKIEIIVGTNEEYVLGYQLHTGRDGKLYLEQSFADHSHTGSIRQVAVGGRYLVSGGTDENIKVFDLVKHVEVGTLMEHTGTVTYLGFHGNRYLFSASEDGKICIFAKKGWKCEKTLKGHKAGVVSVSVHPSGKLALSLSQDQKLRTWNLIKGRKAYITHMDRTADIVQWSPSGATYGIVKGSCLEIYDVASCKVTHSIDFKEKVTVLIYLTEDIIAVAAGDKNVCFYDVTNQFEILQWEAHDLRVKSLSLIPTDDAEEPWLVSASSDGVIRLWKLQLLSLTSKPELLAEVQTTCRIICMAVYIPAPQNKKEEIENIIKKEKSESKETVTSEGEAEDGTKEKKKKKKKIVVSVKSIGNGMKEKKKNKKKKTVASEESIEHGMKEKKQDSVVSEESTEKSTENKTKKKKKTVASEESIENGTKEKKQDSVASEKSTENKTKKNKKKKKKTLASEKSIENGTKEKKQDSVASEESTENKTKKNKKKKIIASKASIENGIKEKKQDSVASEESTENKTKKKKNKKKKIIASKESIENGIKEKKQDSVVSEESTENKTKKNKKKRTVVIDESTENETKEKKMIKKKKTVVSEDITENKTKKITKNKRTQKLESDDKVPKKKKVRVN